MTDRLKLSDPNGDAEPDRVAFMLEMKEHSARIQQLEKNIAVLEAEAKKSKKNPTSAPAGSNKIGARREGTFKAISTAPSINKTPLGPAMVPIPYPTVQDLSSSLNTARSVKFNSYPAYLLDASTQPRCTGDEPGTGKGVKSGTISGEVKPVTGSCSVRIEGKKVVREGDACTMNGGNNPGVYVTVPPTSASRPKDALVSSNPHTSAKESQSNPALDRWVRQTKSNVLQAFIHPWEGIKGAAKGLANTPSHLSELLIKAAFEQRATELDQAASLQKLFGKGEAALEISNVASATRKVAVRIDIPKLAMNNAAQQGGDIISTALQVGVGGLGMIKGAAKGAAAHRLADDIPLASTHDGVKILNGGKTLQAGEKANLTFDIDAEIAALRKIASNLGGQTPGIGERAITRQAYKKLISKYRSEGIRLQAELEAAISTQQYVYRATTHRAVAIYRTNGKISGKSGGTFMSTDFVGLDPKILMDRGQVFPHWGQPEILIRIPASAVTKASVPRPFGDKLKVGWEPVTEAYPAAGSGNMNQFIGETQTWDDAWVIIL